MTEKKLRMYFPGYEGRTLEPQTIDAYSPDDALNHAAAVGKFESGEPLPEQLIGKLYVETYGGEKHYYKGDKK